MEKVIPTFYSGYGRYINRFRMIPSNIDCLIPVERRTLVILNRFGSSKPVKSYKIDGCVTGELHPHGSAYSTLVGLVRGGLASDSDSNWGGVGLNDHPAPASRYSETRIVPWVSKFAFEFIQYVPWEVLELDEEPLYLPCIIPLGLIGDGITTGITFYRTIIPKYKKEDLAKRLKYLIKNGKPTLPKNFNCKMTEDKYGPCIIPQKKDCNITENEKNAFYKLLMIGEGEVNYAPHVEIREVDISEGGKKKKKEKFVSIEGRAPNATFSPLLRAYEKGLLPISCAPIDQCKKQDVCIYLSLKKGTDIDKFIENLSVKYLNKTTHFKIYTCDLSGVVHQTPIDDLLLNCFSYWKNAYFGKLRGDVRKINVKILEYHICSFIRDKLNSNINNIEDILKLWPEKNTIDIFDVNEENRIFRKSYEITHSDIRDIYLNTSIKKLVEFKQTLEESIQRINNIQNEFDQIDEISIKRITDILEGK